MAEKLIRQNIWTLDRQDHWHPIIKAYALAVEVLRGRDADTADTTRWEYQSIIHSESCQHFSWYFLPWHRMYLHRFEELIRATIVELNDEEVDDQTKATWALPYWDYSGDRLTRQLPHAFRAKFVSDDTEVGFINPLRDLTRNPLMNAGGLLPGDAVKIETTLKVPGFTGAGAFGGPGTRWNHWGGAAGALEQLPHNIVHREVSGNMGNPVTSPLDPIFWLHHANIDRLWQVWLDRSPSHVNPDDPEWLTAQPFWFWSSEDPGFTTFTCSKVVNTEVDPLNYSYEPGSGVKAPPIEEAIQMLGEPQDIPQLVGATPDGVQLSGDTTTVSFDLAAPAGFLEGTSPARVYLAADDVTSPDAVGGDYAVYLDVPGAGPESADDHFVGVIAPFGIEVLGSGEHSALRFVFDITELYQTLRAAGQWSDRISVRFVPLEVEAPPGGFADAAGVLASRATPGVLDIGQVGVHFQ
jgi:tyrosinase